MGEAEIQSKEEAWAHLVTELGFLDAGIEEIPYRGIKRWLITSGELPPVTGDGGDQYWLLPNGQIVNTHVLGKGLEDEYKIQYGQPFPYQSERSIDG